MQPPQSKDGLVIRTMKDDMSEMHAVPVVSAVAPIPKAQGGSATEAFPLPAKSGESPKQTTVKPVRTKRKIGRIILAVLVACLLIGGGWYGYVWWAQRENTQVVQEQPHRLEEMVPKEAIAVVSYTSESQAQKDAIKLFWNDKDPAFEGKALDGDPREVAALPGIKNVTYVMLQDNPRPFLVIEKNESSQQYVSTLRSVQLIDEGGWYVLHKIGTESYNEALGRGTVAESADSIITPSTGSIARYTLSAPYASKLLNDMASDAIGLSRIGSFSFEVATLPQDGTIRARATAPVPPVAEKPAPDIAELLTLIPGDADFGRIGFVFSDEVNTWQNENARLDGAVLSQPAVRQFISLLSTPYAVFKRTGADGVRDIGVIIQLPESLRKTLKIGEPIVEQSLSVMIPLVVGKVLGVQVAFHEGSYADVPLRYANITGQTQALDYTIGDTFILISSSREGMSALIDTVKGNSPALPVRAPWQPLFEKSAAMIVGRPITFGNLQDNLLVSLLPIPTGTAKVPALVSTQHTSTESIVDVTLLAQQ
jgi:hypothetical protein